MVKDRVGKGLVGGGEKSEARKKFSSDIGDFFL
jgi:hypothetical protein